MSENTEQFAARIREQYGVDFWLSPPAWGDAYEPHIVRLDSIVVPKAARNAGVGTAIMNEFVRWGDAHGFILSLTPSSDFGGNVRKLKRFYRRFGFVSNGGRYKDFRTRDAMIRYPRSRALTMKMNDQQPSAPSSSPSSIILALAGLVFSGVTLAAINGGVAAYNSYQSGDTQTAALGWGVAGVAGPMIPVLMGAASVALAYLVKEQGIEL